MAVEVEEIAEHDLSPQFRVLRPGVSVGQSNRTRRRSAK